ncbi:hypothetical protein ACFXTN_039805 [Malus domestica]
MRSKVLWKRGYDQTFTVAAEVVTQIFQFFSAAFQTLYHQGFFSSSVFWDCHPLCFGMAMNILWENIILRDEYDLVKFIKMVQQASLFVNLQIGPYVCAEWNFGGFPVWLKYVSGIVFRRTMSLSRQRSCFKLKEVL